MQVQGVFLHSLDSISCLPTGIQEASSSYRTELNRERDSMKSGVSFPQVLLNLHLESLVRSELLLFHWIALIVSPISMSICFISINIENSFLCVSGSCVFRLPSWEVSSLTSVRLFPIGKVSSLNRLRLFPLYCSPFYDFPFSISLSINSFPAQSEEHHKHNKSHNRRGPISYQ